MLDIKFIRENIDAIKKNCLNRGVKVSVDELLEVDEKRRGIQTELDTLRATLNANSKQKPTPEVIEQNKYTKEQIKSMEQEFEGIQERYKALLQQIPNMTHPDTPIGGEEDFVVLETHHAPQTFSFQPKSHDQILLEKDLVDFDRGAKVVGSKFYYSKGDLVRLNLALIQYGMDIVEKYGYTIMETPDLAKQSVLEGAGFNPRGDETQIYNIENTDLSLIGTAEITIGGYHMDEILDLSNGPKKYVALSHCFRTEAGAYGRESKGLYRVHQFSKLEMFVFCKPEESEKLHNELLEIEKAICDGLKIPYRVIDIPTGDLGGPAYRKFDIEAYMTMKGDENSSGDYAEITSTSNCTDYQARRLNIRYINSDGKSEFVHTLNGTAVVLSRFPIALIENHQREDGSIAIPKALQPYFGKDTIS
ncbi:MAG: serine--tRNA ligase [Candidatus Magasanikbacteria bacterium CG11_big_fil_rev_8_21_14_0_20_39_34]|uniref:Serine--tRNA ligase n=1 Tax=Candidatus Magasanikbacteria bacterium CG11_big_fil_rev_8_21_14_0_20_39_34 TaxID=1974653 RepID=A0A2H0N5F4_9BACT|nr:MAG: serine--tRNA ligase [Candidatus Magasanikbacteria bacterium CG11_big_fil_rev_8_21_14_0_20_39_34]